LCSGISGGIGGGIGSGIGGSISGGIGGSSNGSSQFSIGLSSENGNVPLMDNVNPAHMLSERFGHSRIPNVFPSMSSL
ncbi:MAG: hypothetical protein GY835_28505, partial [bacterium]|nr:hypothetical protein [bacterium]